MLDAGLLYRSLLDSEQTNERVTLPTNIVLRHTYCQPPQRAETSSPSPPGDQNQLKRSFCFERICFGGVVFLGGEVEMYLLATVWYGRYIHSCSEGRFIIEGVRGPGGGGVIIYWLRWIGRKRKSAGEKMGKRRGWMMRIVMGL